MRSPRARLAEFDWVIVSAVVVAFGVITGAFTGTVKGYDGWGHLTKVILVLRHFPNVDWNSDWYSGSPFFLGGYPPLFYFGAAVLTRLGADPMVAMNLLVAAAYVAMTSGVYLLTRIVTGSRLAGAVAAGVLLATPGFWTPFVTAGLYTRLFGMGFTALAVLFAVVYLRAPSALRGLACIAAVWGALGSHVVLGVLAVGSVALVLAFAPDDSGRPRLRHAALLVPAVLLAAYYYLPLAFYGQTGAQETAVYPGVGIAGLSPLLPLLPVAAVVVAAWFRFGSASTRRLMAVFGVISAILLLYALLPLPRLAGLKSEEMLFFLAWFTAALTGLAIGSIQVPTTWRPRRVVLALALIGAVVAVVVAAPVVIGSVLSNPAQPQDVLTGWHQVGSTDSMFRVATPSDNLSVWLSGVYDVPQTRGYGAIPQVVNPDWQYWLDTTAWDAGASEDQRTFLLDWYAARWMYVPAHYVSSTAGVVPKLVARPDLYAPVGQGNGGASLTFEYLRASPIAAAANAPAILVIADPANYDIVFRDLSYSGFGSAHAIPVRGGRYVDDYSAQDLAQFDEVVIYGGLAHDAARALDLLSTYVRSGGGLVVDAGAGVPVTGDPFPVTSTRPVEVAGDWRFRAEGSPITDGVDFDAFGPPRYGGGPWTVAAASGIAGWASTALWAGAEPVMVVGQLGEGRVVWLGLNLPYHIDRYRTAEESRFLTNALTWAARPGGEAAGASMAHREGPQQMSVAISAGTRGVLFKESYFDRWHAYLNARELKIYLAGPGFMYVRIPPDATFPATVRWQYERSAADWSGLAVSGATLVAMATWPWSRRRVRAWLDAGSRRWTDED